MGIASPREPRPGGRRSSVERVSRSKARAAASGDRGAALRVALTVGSGIALQLFLIRQAAILIHVTVAFPILAAHVAGWGLGLGLRRSGSVGRLHPAALAAAAAALAWLGTLISTSPGLLLAEELGAWGIVPTALGSGTLTGMSIASALSACRSPVRALVADLAGVGIGGLSHVLLASLWPAVPAPVVWIALLALTSASAAPRASLSAAVLGALLVLPLHGPERLARAETPLGKALRGRGLEAWRGSFFDRDGRIDAVARPGEAGVELYINGGTQAQTPSTVPDRITTVIVGMLRPRTSVVLGAGGMADVATLLEGGVERVTAIERSEAVLDAARAASPAARRILADGRVRVLRGEARRFLASSRERFDLVLLPLSYGSAGVSPAALLFFPTYLFSVEGIRALGDAATPDGAVCFVLPSFELRDRVLATLGEIARQDRGIPLLSPQLWVAENPESTAYSDAVCWAPHAPLAMGRDAPGLTLLHHPARAAASALVSRLEGIDTLPPVPDWRPYFFDVFSPGRGVTDLPSPLSGLLLWTPLGLLLLGGLFLLRRKDPGLRDAPGPDELAVAALTGFAFPALEYVVLSVARGAGFSEGSAYAVVGMTFAGAGLVAVVPRASVAARAMLSVAGLVCAAAFLRFGGISHLFMRPEATSYALGVAVMGGIMTAGVAPFAGLFRAAEARLAQRTEVRALFLASALGTLAAIGPVLLVELRWGGPGCALAAAGVYALALGMALIAPRLRPAARP